MFISVEQLANKINNLERFRPEELQQENKSILYPDTEKELYFNDYKPVPDNLESFSLCELSALYNNVSAAFDNAYIYHSELLASALWNDLLLISGKLESKRTGRNYKPV